MASLGDLIVRVGANIEGFQKNMGTVSQRLNAMNKEAEGAFGGFDRLGSRLSSVGERLSIGLSLPLAGVSAAVIKTSADFEKAMHDIQARGQDIGAPAMERLRELALKLGADTQYSAKQAADGMATLAAAGLTSQQIFETMPGVLRLAAVGQMEINDAAVKLTDVMGQFGAASNETNRYVDIFAQLLNATKAPAGDLAVALQYMGVPAHQAGQSIEEVAAALTLLDQAGMRGEKAGTGVRGMFESLVNPSAKATKVISDLEIKLLDSSGKFLPLMDVMGQFRERIGSLGDKQAQMQALFQVFGREGANAANILMNATAPAIAELRKQFADAQVSIGGMGTASEKTVAILNKGLRYEAEQLKGSLETLAVSAGDVLLPVVTNLAQSLTQLVNTILLPAANIFKALPGPIQDVAGGFLLFLTAVGPVTFVGGKVLSTFADLGKAASWLANGLKVLGATEWAKGIATSLPSLTQLSAGFSSVVQMITGGGGLAGAVSNLGGLLTSAGSAIAGFASTLGAALISPVGIAVVAVTALAAAAYLIYKNWEDVKPVLVGLWTDISNIGTNVWGGLATFFSTAWEGIPRSVAGTWSNVNAALTSAWSGIVDLAQSTWGSIKAFFMTMWDGISGYTATAWTSIVGFLNSTWPGVMGIAASSWEPLRTYFATFWNSTATAMSTAWATISSSLSSIWSGLLGIAQTAWAAIASFFTGVWSGISEKTVAVWTALGELLKTAWQGIASAADAVWQPIVAFFSGIWDTVAKKTAAIWTALLDLLKTIWKAISSSAESIWKVIEQYIGHPLDTLAKLFPKTAQAIKEWGTHTAKAGAQAKDTGQQTANLADAQAKLAKALQTSATAHAAAAAGSAKHSDAVTALANTVLVSQRQMDSWWVSLRNVTNQSEAARRNADLLALSLDQCADAIQGAGQATPAMLSVVTAIDQARIAAALAADEIAEAEENTTTLGNNANTNFKKVGDAAGQAANTVKSQWAQMSADLKETLSAGLGDAMSALATGDWSRVRESLGSIWEGLKETFVGAFSSLWDSLADKFVSGFITKPFDTLVKSLSGQLTNVMFGSDGKGGIVGGLISKVSDWLSDALGGIFGGIFGGAGKAAGQAAGGIGSTVGGAAGGVGGAVGQAVGGTLSSTLGAVFGGISAVTGVIGVIQGMGMSKDMGRVEENTRYTAIDVHGIRQMMWDTVVSRMNAMWEWWTDLYVQIKDAIIDCQSKLMDVRSTTWDAAQQVVAELQTQATKPQAYTIRYEGFTSRDQEFAQWIIEQFVKQAKQGGTV